MIGIVNYGAGNIKALVNQFDILNIAYSVINDSKDFKTVDKIILPGVGSFDYCKSQLINSNLLETLNENVLVREKPVLGICVGMQLMAQSSEEGELSGLSWISGKVRKFDTRWFATKPTIPHMGWNSIIPNGDSAILKGIDSNQGFYFVHSYFFEAESDKNILCRTKYGIEFHSGVNHNHIFGVQFHPEKSHQNGSILLTNFSKL